MSTSKTLNRPQLAAAHLCGLAFVHVHLPIQSDPKQMQAVVYTAKRMFLINDGSCSLYSLFKIWLLYQNNIDSNSLTSY